MVPDWRRTARARLTLLRIGPNRAGTEDPSGRRRGLIPRAEGFSILGALVTPLVHPLLLF